jgi:hypothetical protein
MTRVLTQLRRKLILIFRSGMGASTAQGRRCDLTGTPVRAVQTTEGGLKLRATGWYAQPVRNEIPPAEKTKPMSQTCDSIKP